MPIMFADRINQEKLGKILALVDSDYEGEAVAAFRTAKQFMVGSGISFGDLIQSARKFKTSPPKNDYHGARHKIAELSRLLSTAQSLVKKKTQEIKNLRFITRDLGRQVSALEKALKCKSVESKGWRDRAWRILWEKESEISKLKSELKVVRENMGKQAVPDIGGQ